MSTNQGSSIGCFTVAEHGQKVNCNYLDSMSRVLFVWMAVLLDTTGSQAELRQWRSGLFISKAVAGASQQTNVFLAARPGWVPPLNFLSSTLHWTLGFCPMTVRPTQYSVTTTFSICHIVMEGLSLATGTLRTTHCSRNWPAVGGGWLLQSTLTVCEPILPSWLLYYSTSSPGRFTVSFAKKLLGVSDDNSEVSTWFSISLFYASLFREDPMLVNGTKLYFR